MQVTIRPLQVQDAYTSVNWRNDTEVFKYTGNTYDHEITVESELEWIRRVIVNPNDYRCAILADNVYVGNIYLTDIQEGVATYQVFIGDRNYWGRGVAKKASEIILNYAFRELKLERVYLRVKKGNVPAIMLYRALCFKEIESDEKWISMVLYNINWVCD